MVGNLVKIKVDPSCMSSVELSQGSQPQVKLISNPVVVLVVCIRSHNWSARQRHHRLQSVV